MPSRRLSALGWEADSRPPQESLLQVKRQRGGIFRRTGYNRRLQAQTLPLANPIVTRTSEMGWEADEL